MGVEGGCVWKNVRNFSIIVLAITLMSSVRADKFGSSFGSKSHGLGSTEESQGSMSRRGFPGMGDGMIPGFGKRSFGFGKRSFGPEMRSFGFGKRSFGPEMRSFGFGKRSFGPEMRSFGPEMRSFGFGKRSFGPEMRSFGYGKRSFGFKKRSMGFKKRKSNDANTRRSTRVERRDLGMPSPGTSGFMDSKNAVGRNDPDDSSEYPGDNKRRKTLKSKSRDSGMGDFGGGFSNYLKMLEGDPISENQDLQEDVFGGGMSGKYWDMYKGEDSDESVDMFEEMEDDKRDSRQSPEEDQPEDAPNNERTLLNDSTETYVVAFKSPKAKVLEFYNQLKEAIHSKDKSKVNSLLNTLETRKLNKKESRSFTEQRKLMIIDEEELMDKGLHDHGLSTNESDIQDKFKDFIDKLNKNIPDPITLKKGIPSTLKSFSISGLSDFKVVGKVKKGLGHHWKGTASLPSIFVSVASSSGPAVPFSGKVIGIFKAIRVHMTFKVSDDGIIHITSIKTKPKQMKFVPKFDSSVPLNPWSKVSMSGYLMSRIKKYIPNAVDKIILKLTHVIENLEKDK